MPAARARSCSRRFRRRDGLAPDRQLLRTSISTCSRTARTLNRGGFLEGTTPRQQFSLRSLLDLPGGLQLDAQFRHSTELERQPEIVVGPGIDAYSELDVRLAWQASEQLELALVGQNLLHDHHVEFGTPEARGEIERSVYGKVTWQF